MLILLLTDAFYLAGLFPSVGLKFMARYIDNFSFNLSAEGTQRQFNVSALYRLPIE